MSAIHHIYHENDIGIANLDIRTPLALKDVPFGKVGEFCGIDLLQSSYRPMDRFPPMLINSKNIKPIEIAINKKSGQSLASKNVTIKSDTILANCSKMIETEFRSAMCAWSNIERFKRFMKELSRICKEDFTN